MRRFERLVHNLNNCMEYLNPYDILLHITLNTNDRILIKDKHEHQSVQEFNKIIIFSNSPKTLQL